MKILWITNIPFGKLRGMAGLSGEDAGGSWLHAALNDFAGDSRFQLTVATVSRVKTIKSLKEGNITYCLLPGGFPAEYDHTKKSNYKHWENIKEIAKPDIVQVWGTEFTHGYLALQLMRDIPSVLYMQGVLKSIYRYYLAGMSRQELRRSITLRDILQANWITRTQHSYSKRALIEAEMIKLSKNVIVENMWCASYCKAVDPECTIYKCALNIREEFFKNQWTTDKIKPYTIMCNAAGYPIKGLHILLKAFNQVVRRFPDSRLLIPGENSPFDTSWKQRLKETGYSKHIKQLITILGLQQNIEFLGRLSADEMASQMARVNAFVVPSCIENHSATLIEAMIVGTPCVASYVGGIPEYLTHNENGLLYRFEEYEILAEHICKIFSDQEYALKLGRNASSSMRRKRSSEDLRKNLLLIYNTIIDSKNIPI